MVIPGAHIHSMGGCILCPRVSVRVSECGHAYISCIVGMGVLSMLIVILMWLVDLYNSSNKWLCHVLLIGLYFCRL